MNNKNMAELTVLLQAQAFVSQVTEETMLLE